MTILRLKDLTAFPPLPGRGAKHWCYDRAELIADSIVHVTGLSLGLIAATALIVLAGVYASTLNLVTTSIYAAGLIAMLAFSASYNLWPVSPVKWVLRRFDHSAIYVLIAATYTPFAVMYAAPNGWPWLLVCMWAMACLGIGRVLQVGDLSRSDKVFYGVMGFLPAVGLGELSRQAPMSVITAILVAIALSIGLVIQNKIESKAGSIDLDN